MTSSPVPMRPVRIATRGSAQARTQTEAVAELLRRAHPGLQVEPVIVETTGDRNRDVPLHQIGGQGVFVKEVQHAVLSGAADIAVHSAKDLTSSPTDGLTIAAVPTRRDPRDALIGARLDELAEGATVATGSARRRSQLLALRPDLRCVELRGNIATRLDRIPTDGAIVMAVAALQVLDMTDRIAQLMSVDEMIPQVGQGAVAIECRTDDLHVLDRLSAIQDPFSRWCVDIERAFLAELGGGCTMPVGAHVAGGVLAAYLASDDGARRLVRQSDPLPDDPIHAQAMARDLARGMRADLA